MGGVNIMAPTTVTKAPPRAAKPWYKILYLQVLIAILLGIVVGWLWPNLATNDWIKALGDGFIKLIKMVIAPIIFCTVVSGIAHIDDARKVGRVGVKALIYFEVVSSFALILGLVVGNLVQVGHGSTVGPNTLLCAQVGLAGSTTIGKGVILAGQVGVAGHCTVGDGAMATAQSGIPGDVAPGKIVSGYPAIDNRQWLRSVALFNRLPELLRDIKLKLK